MLSGVGAVAAGAGNGASLWRTVWSLGADVMAELGCWCVVLCGVGAVAAGAGDGAGSVDVADAAAGIACAIASNALLYSPTVRGLFS